MGSRILETGSVLEAGSVQYLASPAILQNFAYAPITDVVKSFTHNIMITSCKDYAFGEPGAVPHIAATLRRELGDETIATCQDIRSYCAGTLSFVRTVCPETCGCALPRSGLYRNGPERGCPVADCRATPEYLQALDTIPCQDPAPAELRNMTAWAWLLEHWSTVNTGLLPHMAGHYAGVKATLFENGCTG